MISDVLEAIQDSGAIEYTRNLARLEAERAMRQLNIIPGSRFKQILIQLAEQAVKRDY